MLMFNSDGRMNELTASGATSFSRKQTRQALELLDVLRRRGRSDPAFLLRYVHTQAPTLAPLVASGLAERGFDVRCRLCARNVPGKSYSRAAVNRLFRLDTLNYERSQHRKHFRRRSTIWGTNPGRPDSHREPHEPPPPGQNEQGRRLLRGEPIVDPLPDEVQAALLSEVPTTWNGANAYRKKPSQESE